MEKADKSITQARKERLTQYIYIKGEYEDYEEELTRLENNACIPATKESDGSKKNPGASDRMANAAVKYMEYKAEVEPDMARIKAEMDTIKAAISGLRDGLERQVLRLRYIIGDTDENGEDVRDQMPWRKVSLRMFKSDDDAKLQIVYRIHGRALQNIDLEGLED